MKLPRRNFLHGRGSCRAASVIAVEPGGGCCYYNGASFGRCHRANRNPAVQQTLPRVCYPKGMMREWANEV
jgi:hypothetical protein